MTYDTDIASELLNKTEISSEKGVFVTNTEVNGVGIFKVNVTTACSALRKGNFVTLDFPHFATINHKSSAYINVLADELRALLPEAGKTLVVGLGNPYLTADSLGPKALTGLFVTGHLPQATINELSLRRLYAFSCGVQAASGINTNELLQQMVQLIKPTCVICIDSLCAKSATRLGNCVQISTNGLCSLGKEPIDMELLGVPVIGLGVPTVMRLAEDPTLSITPKDINIIIKRASSLLALGINCAVQKSLSLQEICLLTS